MLRPHLNFTYVAVAVVALVVLLAPAAAWAQDAGPLDPSDAAPALDAGADVTTPDADEGASRLDTGDTAWMLVSCALVMLMTPGLALFYGGLVRPKNVLNTMMMSMIALGVMTLQWVFVGYSISFGSDIGGFIGNPTEYLLFRGVGLEPGEGETIPPVVFAMFQGMFAIITPALISGAIAERMKFRAYVLFILLWGTFVYDPICHWVWGPGGWLLERGALDFAGGTVVHISSGVSALVAALIIGPRLGYPKEPMPPHNLVISGIGAGLLWFGWFGFNAGSALKANHSAALAFTTTHIAAASGATFWALAEVTRHGKASALGVISGIVAGLVGITPAAGFVSPAAAIAIGGAAGIICYAAVEFKSSRGYDDSLDAFGVHGIGGTVGALLTGVFAREAWGDHNGLLAGNSNQFVTQVIAVVATWVYAVIMTVVILQVVRVLAGGLRATPENETQGMDLADHGEVGYNT